MELAAAEPTVVDPVALGFDELGRMYVAENRDYPTGPGEGQPPGGMIALLEDADGDGRCEKRTLFADGLTFPNGVLPWRRGLIVTCAPDVLYLKDTDGDGRADERRVLLTGFSTKGSTQLRVSHPTLGPDGWIYLTSGLTGGKITAPDFPEQTAVEIGRTDLRFRPDTGEIEPADGGSQFGLTFDDFGHRFICYNRVQAQHVVLSARSLKRNPNLPFSETVQNLPEEMLPEPLKGHGSAARIFPISTNVTTADSHAGTFTAACGVLVYRGTALPQDYYGAIFSCDPTGNLVHCDKLVPNGATFLARPARHGIEFLASPDEWFRPVFLAHGPDGALYICDMYRKAIEHPEYLPEEVRKRTDFESGKGMGRIWRVRGLKSQAPSSKFKVQGSRFKVQSADGSVGSSQLSVARQGQTASFSTDQGSLTMDKVTSLDHPNGWHRETAFRLLLESRDTNAVSLLLAKLPSASLGELGELWKNRPLRALQDPPFGPHLARIHTLNALVALTDWCKVASKIDKRSKEQPGPEFEKLWAQLLSSTFAESPGVRETAWRWLSELAGEGPEVGDDVLRYWAEDPSPRVRFQHALAVGGWSWEAFIPSLVRIALRDGADKWTRAAVLSGIRGREGQFSRQLFVGETEPAADFAYQLGRVVANTPAAHSLITERLRATNEPFAVKTAFVTGVGDALVRRTEEKPVSSVLQAMLAGSPSAAGFDEFRSLAQRAGEIAGDATAPASQRLRAIALLGHAPAELANSALLPLLDTPQSIEFHNAAVRALAQPHNPGAAANVLAATRWTHYTPAVRATVLSSLLSRGELLPGVFSAIEAGLLPVAALDSSQRNQLLKHKDEAIRQRAAKLFQKAAPEDRMKTYETYKSVLSLKADAANGGRLFELACANCHRLDRVGVAVGPDLFSIRNQPKEAILLHIIVPEYEIMPGFANYEVAMKDGQTLAGLIVAETSTSLTLRRALGEEESVLRSSVASVTASNLSLMPQEIEKTMTRQELADLVAYLKGEAR